MCWGGKNWGDLLNESEFLAESKLKLRENRGWEIGLGNCTQAGGNWQQTRAKRGPSFPPQASATNTHHQFLFFPLMLFFLISGLGEKQLPRAEKHLILLSIPEKQNQMDLGGKKKMGFNLHTE